MPIIDGADFVADGWYRNGHYNTFIPALFLKNPDTTYKRKRLITTDDDFIDVDFSMVGADKAVVICHGLEGDSSSGYIKHFVDYFNKEGWDAIVPNYRGCSGEMNNQLRMYNSGTTDDLDFIINSTIADYNQVVLIGFSLGGNLILKYLGERTFKISDKINGGIAISAPVNLSNASKELLKAENFAYQIRFLRSLINKILKKKRQFPDQISLKPLLKTYNLYQFDNYFTAPIYGYRDAEDYYSHNSSLQFLGQLERPALLINSLDDPFLGELCYPRDIAEKSKEFFYCSPVHGGHVGFVKNKSDRDWLKHKSHTFIKSIV
jgi:predicted alpha/beta-fold hydrolase